MTNMDKANEAYSRFLKEFGWKETDHMALAKFGCVIGFSFFEALRQKKAGVPEDDMAPYSEHGARIIDSLNGDNGDLVVKMIRAKYMSGFAGYYFNFKAYLMMIRINILMFIADKLGLDQ